MPSLIENLLKSAPVDVTEVPAGDTAILRCNSNDYKHNFLFWLLNHDKIIGPGNEYDESKYKYEVLSGKLLIKQVKPEESGTYRCFSQQVNGTGHNMGAVEMLVKGGPHAEPLMVDTALNAVNLVAILVSFIVIIACAIIYIRLKREWSKYDGRRVVAVDNIDEEEGDEIYNRTTTSINQPVPGPSRNASSDQLYGIDNQGLDTDFNSVFEQIQIKSPPRSLI